MSNQMDIIIKLKQTRPITMLKKNNIIINLKKKKHIKLVFSRTVKKLNKEKEHADKMQMDYDYAYSMDKYDRYNEYDKYDRYDGYDTYNDYDRYDDRCCTYDEDYGTYGEEKLYGFTDDFETYWDSIYN